MSEITNILNFDLKHIDLKDEQISELKDQQKDHEQAKIEEINHFKTKIQDDIAGIKNDYETQQEQMREEHRKKETVIAEKQNEIEQI